MTPAPTESAQATPSPVPVTEGLLDRWATDPAGPVALHLRQTLLPVEVDGRIVFPPTYADIGYNIDTLMDGTRVATIDSVGSQANRMEPIFKAAPTGQEENPLAALVPQIEVALQAGRRLSILDLAHRSADAVVQSSPRLRDLVAQAFQSLKTTGDAGPLCAIAPTSLVFGVWDSRGGTGEKRPRIVRAIIRARGVEPLHAAAQFNSVWKALDDEQRSQLEAEAKAKKAKLSEKGFADAPAVFRKIGQNAAKAMPEFRDGAPNPARRVLGGVVVNGTIERDVTVNLIALRGLRAEPPHEATRVHKYLLGLSLLAATADIDLFLREGCQLRYAGEDVWHAVPRRGELKRVDLASSTARALVLGYARAAAEPFRSQWPTTLEYAFDIREAKKLLAKKDEDISQEQ